MKLMLAQNTAQQRAAARTEQQARSFALRAIFSLPLPPAAWRFIRPGGQNGRRANPCADGKGAGESVPPLRAIIYE